MWWVAAVPCAVAAVPVDLPAGEDTTRWRNALDRADLVATDVLPADGPWVGVDVVAGGWRITAVDALGVRRTLDVAVPTTDEERARIAWLGASLAEGPALPVRAPIESPAPEMPRPARVVAPTPRSEPAPAPEEGPIVLADRTLPLFASRPFEGASPPPLPDPAGRGWPRALGLSVGPRVGLARHADLAAQVELGATMLLRAGPVHLRGTFSGTTGSDDQGERYSEMAVQGGLGASPNWTVAPVLAAGYGALRERWTIPEVSKHTHWGPSAWVLVGLRADTRTLPPFELALTSHPTERGWTHAIGVTTWIDLPK